MEKTFNKFKLRKTARSGYVHAEVVTALASQIRAMRVQRGWSQKDLAAKMATTQAQVSRLEDPSYGRLSLKTLLDLSDAFDTGLEVRFVSLITMLKNTLKVDASLRQVPSFEEESVHVFFYDEHTPVDYPRPQTLKSFSEEPILTVSPGAMYDWLAVNVFPSSSLCLDPSVKGDPEKATQ